jgi:hypothetical protein
LIARQHRRAQRNHFIGVQVGMRLARKSVSTALRTMGLRVEPPTSTTSSLMQLQHGPSVRSTQDRKGRQNHSSAPDDAAELSPLQFNADHLKRQAAQILGQMLKGRKITHLSGFGGNFFRFAGSVATGLDGNNDVRRGDSSEGIS